MHIGGNVLLLLFCNIVHDLYFLYTLHRIIKFHTIGKTYNITINSHSICIFMHVERFDVRLFVLINYILNFFWELLFYNFTTEVFFRFSVLSIFILNFLFGVFLFYISCFEHFYFTFAVSTIFILHFQFPAFLFYILHFQYFYFTFSVLSMFILHFLF